MPIIEFALGIPNLRRKAIYSSGNKDPAPVSSY